MFIKEYVCKKCELLQEKWLSSSEDKNEEVCENCQASPEHLIPALSTITKHGSWSRWNVG